METNINKSTVGQRLGNGVDNIIHIVSVSATKVKAKVESTLEERKKAKAQEEEQELKDLSQAVYDKIKDEFEVEIPKEVVQKLADELFRNVTDIVDRRIHTKVKEIVDLTVEKMRSRKS